MTKHTGIARLATALLLADVRLAEWMRLPPKQQALFALSHGIPIADIDAANRAFGRFRLSESKVVSGHRCEVLDAMFETRPALPGSTP